MASNPELVKRGKDGSRLANGISHLSRTDSSHADVPASKDEKRKSSLSKPGDDESLAKSFAPILVAWVFSITLIFGGCCSNVYALEAIIKEEQDSGLLITFFQFLLVALFTWPANASLSNPPTFLKPRAVPLSRWIPNVLLFLTVNLMNNFAFGLNISVPVHIILRSGGSVTTLVVGWVWGKRYSRSQIAGVVMLTIGVIVAAMADAQSKGKMGDSAAGLSDFNLGLAILFVAQLLSAIMGVYVQNTYAIYGSHWRENLFYSHFLSLPFFIFLLPSLYKQYQRLLDSPPVTIAIPQMDVRRGIIPQLFGSSIVFNPTAKAGQVALLTMPKHVFNLILNALTQYACIRGVNLLGARTTALGVTIVLNVRKLVSLFLSIWLFGNTLSFGVLIGAAIVFSGAGVYAWGGSKKPQAQTQASSKKSA